MQVAQMGIVILQAKRLKHKIECCSLNISKVAATTFGRSEVYQMGVFFLGKGFAGHLEK